MYNTSKMDLWYDFLPHARTHEYQFIPSNRSQTLDGLCFKIVRYSVATIQIAYRFPNPSVV